MSYDDGDITERERLAASRQKEIADFNANALKEQHKRTLWNYDMADEQNARMRDVQLAQMGRKNMADRFETRRNLQNAALGLFGSMGAAMNGSSTGNILAMLENRDDADNSTYWEQHQQNNDTVNNAYNESLNQNQVSRNDATTSASKGLMDIEADTAANLSNINPNLYVEPGTGGNIQYANNFYWDKVVPANYAEMSGYIMPENSAQNVRPRRNMMRGNDYFGRLMNNFNYRRY